MKAGVDYLSPWYRLRSPAALLTGGWRVFFYASTASSCERSQSRTLPLRVRFFLPILVRGGPLPKRRHLSMVRLETASSAASSVSDR